MLKSKEAYRNNLFRRTFFNKLLVWNYFFIQKTYDPKISKKYINFFLKKKNEFLKILIIRGIGYRAFITANDFRTSTVGNFYFLLDKFLYSKNEDNNIFENDAMFVNNVVLHELINPFYLTLRVGHTKDANWRILANAKVMKKNRKLILSSKAKSYVNFITNYIWEYRKPSPYTGRGIRKKKFHVIRKEGKKDQKGRGF